MPGEAAQTGADATGRVREAYLAAVLAPNARQARRLVTEALADGVSAAEIYLRVLQPALEEIGRRWELAEISVAAEHLATQITQAVLAQLAADLSPGAGGRGRRAIVSCSPGELHSLGPQMVSDFLEADGWEVLMLGPDVPSEDLAALAEEQDVAVVALSTALAENLLSAHMSCVALRKLPRPPFIVAGGRAFGRDAAKAEVVGADAFAVDPVDLLEMLDDRLP